MSMSYRALSANIDCHYTRTITISIPGAITVTIGHLHDMYDYYSQVLLVLLLLPLLFLLIYS